MALARLPAEEHNRLVDYRTVCPSRISTPQSRKAIGDALTGMQLERRAVEQGDLVVIGRDRPPQQIAGASSWRVNSLNDLKVVTPTRVYFFGKSRWRYLLLANQGVLRSGPDPQLLLVASAKAAR